MNSSIELNAGGLPPASALPLTLLALVEMAQLKRAYAPFLEEPPEHHRWFVMRGKEALPPMAFREVLWLLAKGQGPLTVLRESEADQEPTPWHTLDYQACASNRATALAATVAFWVLVVFFGWAGLVALGPRDPSGLLQKGYFVVAFALVGWLSLPEGMRGRRRAKQY